MDAYVNFAWSTVLVPPNTPIAGTSLTVALGTGTRFPAAPFYAVAKPQRVKPLSTNCELVRVTAVVGDVLTITRAQGITTAKTIALGWEFYNGITSELLDQIIAAAAPPAMITNTHVYFATPNGRYLKIAGASVASLPPP